jgi:hypothetical protein
MAINPGKNLSYFQIMTILCIFEGKKCDAKNFATKKCNNLGKR